MHLAKRDYFFKVGSLYDDGRCKKPSSDGWSHTQNSHGFVFEKNGEKVYLGKGCDALSFKYGKGKWYWDDEGVTVHLAKRDYFFKVGSLYDDGRCKK